MTDDFNPGEGWREVPWERLTNPYIVLRDGDAERYWVPAEPVSPLPPEPPLPTEPYTVIEVAWIPQWSQNDEHLVRTTDGRWMGLDDGDDYSDINTGHITGWKPVAEPRALTAKAVIDRIEFHQFGATDGSLAVAAEFEVKR